ncbi:hypothetical protein [Streptomyces sp. NPDC051183]|uniref:hypothetical protein n=1 Tax=unclassified Streptomyces TaxID=2593676 RepID=UPI00344850F7
MSLRLLRLYPEDFRRAFGDEMSEAYREATEDAGPLTRLREAGDIVAHALRLRLRVGSAHRGGRLFAAAAPFALAATGAYSASLLASSLNYLYVTGQPDSVGPLGYAMNGFHLLTFIGTVIALGGRFAAGTRCAFAGSSGTAACLLVAVLPGALHMPLMHAAYLIPPLAVAAVPLLCPPDLRPYGRIRSGAGRLALMVWALLSVVILALPGAEGSAAVPLWRFTLPLAAALVLLGREALSGVRTAGQFTLAVVPLLVTGYFAGSFGRDTALPFLGMLAFTALAVRMWRRRRSGSLSRRSGRR